MITSPGSNETNCPTSASLAASDSLCSTRGQLCRAAIRRRWPSVPSNRFFIEQIVYCHSPHEEKAHLLSFNERVVFTEALDDRGEALRVAILKLLITPAGAGRCRGNLLAAA